MYNNICSKCKESFLTGERQDKLCCHCDGSMPRLKYSEMDKK